MMLRVNRRFADGFMLDANYTWSRNRDNSDTVEDNQGFNAGGDRAASATTSPTSSTTCTSASATCRTGWSGRSCTSCRSARASRSALERPSSTRSQAAGRSAGRSSGRPGFPIAVSGASTRRGAGAAGPRRRASPSCCRRTCGAGTTARRRSRCRAAASLRRRNRTYLKYNPDAFVGRVVTTPNGRIVADQFWDGNADITYDEIRTDNRFNIDLSIRRDVQRCREACQLEVGADAMNILNHTQFSGAYTGGLGGTRSPRRIPRSGSCRAWGTPTTTARAAWRRTIRGRSCCAPRCGSEALRLTQGTA